jgi:hypothetical protein
MKTKAHKPSNQSQDLTAAQMSDTVNRSGLSRGEFAERVGCGTSQLFKYQKEGLPPRLNRNVHANILRMALETGVLPRNAALLARIDKLSKGIKTTENAQNNAGSDKETTS